MGRVGRALIWHELLERIGIVIAHLEHQAHIGIERRIPPGGGVTNSQPSSPQIIPYAGLNQNSSLRPRWTPHQGNLSA